MGVNYIDHEIYFKLALSGDPPKGTNHTSSIDKILEISSHYQHLRSLKRGQTETANL